MRIREFLIPLILFVLVIAIFVNSALKDMHVSCDVAESQLKRSAGNISNVLRPGISRALQTGDLKSLKKYLTKIVKTTEISAIRLESADEKLFIVPTEKVVLASGKSCCHSHDHKDRFIYHTSQLSPSTEGMQALNLSPISQLKLVIAMPLQACQQAEEAAYETFKIKMIWGTAIGFAFLLASFFSLRNTELSRKLNFSRKREEQFQEFNLASAGLAHETKNPLSIIRGQAESLLQHSSCGPEITEVAEEILHQADRTVDRLGDFMNYARVEARKVEVFDMKSFFEKLTGPLRSGFDLNKVNLILQMRSASITADKELLRHIIINLLINSYDAMPNGGDIKISSDPNGQTLSLKISDQGEGIPAELKESLFTPYVTGKATGHGIGLSIVKRAIEASGWTINFTSSAKGTDFIIQGIKINDK